MASNSATALATQQSIKAYVDSQVGTVDTLAEILANGNTSGGTNIVVSSGDVITTNTINETTAASGVTIDGVLVKDGEVDGRDVSVDGTKLDTVETNADVTDTANVTAAGALMDSELTNIAAVKALDQGVATTDSPSFAGLTATTADINGGTIDGTTIGGAAAAAGTFTTLGATGIAGFASGSTAAPGIGFSADTDNGLVYINSDNWGTVAGGSYNLYFQGSQTYSNKAFYALDAAGPAFLNEAASSTNPTLVPNRADLDTGLGWVSTDIGALVAGGVNVLNWNSSGNVGIGTSSPGTPLHVEGTAAGNNIAIRVNNTDTSGYSTIQMGGTDAGIYRNGSAQTGYGGASSLNLITVGAHPIAFSTSNTPRVIIDSSGNVGIGTSSPLTDLVTVGTTMATSQAYVGSVSDTSYSGGIINLSNSSRSIGITADPTNAGVSSLINFSVDGSERMRIDSSGNVGIGTASPSEKLDVVGNVTISGSLSKGSGSFRIDHPVKPDTHHLVHSFVEAPTADNIYRGSVVLVDGVAKVDLDTAARLTAGTFEALNTNVDCWVSNKTGWTAVRATVIGSTLSIEAEVKTCTDIVSWLVIGERHDQTIIDANWTDESGRVITEPEKDK
jgi:hypothetical protein